MSDIISTNRELDAACARALGKPWTKPTHGRCCTCQDCGWDHDNCQCGYLDNSEKSQLLEDEIERRGIAQQRAYALALRIEVDDGQLSPLGPMATTWFIIRATTEQRARAFLKAIEAA